MTIVPPLLLVLSAVVIVLAALAGVQPLWASTEMSLSAAAHEGDSATVYRMLRRGADPNRPGDVSVSSTTVLLTPLEAAVESRQVETLQVLLKGGARLADADRPRLLCLARAASAPEVESFLRSAARDAVSRNASAFLEPTDCSRVTLPPH